MNLDEKQDKELIELSAEGSMEAFVQLIRRYEKPLRRLIHYKINNDSNAQDVFQETLISAWQNITNIKHSHKFKAWIFQIARNKCRDYYRSAQRNEFPLESNDLEQKVNRYGRGYTIREDRVDQIHNSLEQISALEKEAILLFYFEGLTISEIARRSGRPLGTIKRRLHSARHHLRHNLNVTKNKRKEDNDE